MEEGIEAGRTGGFIRVGTLAGGLTLLPWLRAIGTAGRDKLEATAGGRRAVLAVADLVDAGMVTGGGVSSFGACSDWNV